MMQADSGGTSNPAPSAAGAAGVSFNIRIVTLEGSPWFVAADVCRALGMDVTKGTYQWLAPISADQKQLTTPKKLPELFHGTFAPSTMLIAESGLYKLILRSDKPQARAFQDWVTRIVLPTIRATGSYVVGEEKLSDPAAPRDELEAISEAVEGLLGRAFRDYLQTFEASLRGRLDGRSPVVPGRPIGREQAGRGRDTGQLPMQPC